MGHEQVIILLLFASFSMYCRSTMGDTSESPKIGLCTMLGLSLLCTIDYFLYMASVFSWLTLPDTQLLGWLGLLHIVVYGASSSFVPRADTTMGTDRYDFSLNSYLVTVSFIREAFLYYSRCIHPALRSHHPLPPFPFP